MELYIKINQGHPVDHPMQRKNMQQAWPDLDFDNLGENFARFRRIPAPVPGVYEVVQDCEYRWNGDWVEDHWIIRPMTPEEKTAKQTAIKENWTDFLSWTWNEDTCAFDPPVPYPTDGGRYRWNEQLLTWELVQE